jgi:hypothetical protein
LDRSDILIKHTSGKLSVFINTRKGGIINIFNESGIDEVDFDWRTKLPKGKVAVTHWQDNDYDVKRISDNQYEVFGNMSAHGWMKTTPARHMILRIMSFLMGNRLIPLLKKAMISGKTSLGIKFNRKILIEDSKITIEDGFSGRGLHNKKLYRAPHYSLRHVSSAGQFVPEEMIEVEDESLKADPDTGTINSTREIQL